MIRVEDIESMTWKSIQSRVNRFGEFRHFKYQLSITFTSGEIEYFTFKPSHKLTSYMRRLYTDQLPEYMHFGEVPKVYWNNVLRHLSCSNFLTLKLCLRDFLLFLHIQMMKLYHLEV